jgi:hypothetical protein
VVPIVMPLVKAVGIDPVHFGLVVTLNLGIGQQTPPVASVLIDRLLDRQGRHLGGERQGERRQRRASTRSQRAVRRRAAAGPRRRRARRPQPTTSPGAARRRKAYGAALSEAERDEGFRCYDTEDFRIGVQAFLAKTTPEFVGR